MANVVAKIKFEIEILQGEKKMRKRGFTLLELLIVLVVIGILSVMLMIASEEIQDSARATEVINNLNAWKKATLAYWADNYNEITANENFNLYDHRDEIIKYFSISSEAITDMEGEQKYWPIQTNDGRWWIWCGLGSGTGNQKRGLKAKLAARAEEIGLFSPGNYDYYKNADHSIDEKYIYNGGDQAGGRKAGWLVFPVR